MTLAEKQQRLIDDYLLIDDSQERLGAIVDDARRQPSLPESERTGDNRITGCVSLAWIAGDFREGCLHFRSDADSPLVRGLLKVLCDFHNGATPAEIAGAGSDPELFERLGLAKSLSPTRLNGLRSARIKIREIAARHLA